ncbi:MAG: RimK family alpha-L-glutamate ligase [Alphaproteobacteria bacterium]|nr:RimK family alpha-L-glutamate ligase [Alphaproteobacteria bacterium]
MEVWILFYEDIESSTNEAFEIRRFQAEAKDMGITLKVFSPEQFDLLVTDEDRKTVLIDGEPETLPDFLLPRTPPIESGYFSLAVIRQLERLGVETYNGSVCIEAVADKMHTHQILCEQGLPTPITMLAKFPVDIALVEKHIGFPVVVKTLLGVNGTGVFLVETEDAFNDLMNLIGETNPNIQLIFQKYVAASRGRDLRVFVVDGEVLACMERRAKDGGFKANFSQGGAVEQFDLDEEAKQIAIRTSEVLDIRVAGIDLLFTDDGFTICEANTFPGFKGLEQACDINVPRSIFESMQRRLDEKFEPEFALDDQAVV